MGWGVDFCPPTLIPDFVKDSVLVTALPAGVCSRFGRRQRVAGADFTPVNWRSTSSSL